MWLQRKIGISPKKRGCHLITTLITDQIPEIQDLEVGLLHVFIQHTSASLTLNENADPDVRTDMETGLNHLAPENLDFRHTIEGPDDMPAHIKASLLGASVCIPVSQGRLALGTWQGIYLCEHRNHGGQRSLVATLMGQCKQ